MDSQHDSLATLESLYSDKPSSYFANARTDFVSLLPANSEAAVLELGCGAGRTGELALTQRRCSRYVGIEIDERAALAASRVLTEVVHANVETAKLDFAPASFDALLMSEVLEHLVDPWTTVARLVQLLKPGALVMASSPNVSYYRVILNLLVGRFDLTDRGIMDRTHLRWFTPRTYQEMFENAGVRVDRVYPLSPFGPKASIVNAITFSRLQHLLMTQICLVGHNK